MFSTDGSDTSSDEFNMNLPEIDEDDDSGGGREYSL